MTNKVKEHNGFYFLLTEIQLCALIFFEMEYIPQGILNKKINPSTYLEHNFATCCEQNLMILLCVDFNV